MSNYFLISIVVATVNLILIIFSYRLGYILGFKSCQKIANETFKKIEEDLDIFEKKILNLWSKNG